MDTRMKIIAAVFLLVIVFYFLQFMLEFVKKKEHFTSSYFDDVEQDTREHFEDAKPPAQKPSPPQPSDNNKPYELRIFILDEIEKLNITDKNVKGNVMESLFSETSMKELEGMSKEERIAKVKSVYEGAKGASAPAAPPVAQEKPPTTGQGTVKQETKTSEKFIEDKIKAYFTNEVKIDDEPNESFKEAPKKEAPKKEAPAPDDLQRRMSKATQKLDVVIDGLKEMKGILSTGKETYEPPLPNIPKDPFLVEGFENIRAYAYY